uniref:Uncharacterized protein n=1 Tax=Syphacia muris TaxID=451379 RepID=A0A0N5AYV2_9BILA
MGGGKNEESNQKVLNEKSNAVTGIQKPGTALEAFELEKEVLSAVRGALASRKRRCLLEENYFSFFILTVLRKPSSRLLFYSERPFNYK